MSAYFTMLFAAGSSWQVFCLLVFCKLFVLGGTYKARCLCESLTTADDNKQMTMYVSLYVCMVVNPACMLMVSCIDGDTFLVSSDDIST